MRARTCAVALLLALLAPLPGCFVAEELEAGEKLLEQHGGAGGHRDPAAATAARDEEKGPSLKERAEGWWQQARSLHPGERSAGIVRCEVDGGVHFTRSEECLAKGGTPRS